MFTRGMAAFAALLLAAGGAAWADGDLMRLGGTGDAKVSTLGFDGNADLLLTRGYGGHGGHGHGGYGHGGYGHGGYGHGGYGHGHGGYGHYARYGGYGYGGYGHYARYGGYGYNGYGRGYYNGYGHGYYRPYYASYFRPYYYASYFRPYFYGAYSSYYPSYYAPYYYYPYPYYYGYSSPYVVISAGAGVGAEAPMYTLPAPTPVMPDAGGMPPANGADTYPYDGGSKTPLPIPGTVPSGPMPPAPMSKPEPRPTVPAQGRFVSLPATATPYTFAAYGEQPATVVRTVGTTLRTSTTASSTPTSPFAYPAYGEQPGTRFASDRLIANR